MPNTNGFVANLARHIGQTVTIFTTSGGQSGRGFTGVLVSVNCNFVRLITQIGPAPGCALGNCCDVRENTGNISTECPEEENDLGVFGNEINFLGTNNQQQRRTQRRTNRENMGTNRFDCDARRTLGAVVDIPVDRIASFVHNSVGSI